MSKGAYQLDERSGCTFGMHPDWKTSDWDYLREVLMEPDLTTCYYKKGDAIGKWKGNEAVPEEIDIPFKDPTRHVFQKQRKFGFKESEF